MAEEKNRGTVLAELRRARMAASPPVLRGGFRPFFLGAAVWALVALTLWVPALFGTLALPSAFDPLAWHRHEMLFGFIGAAVAGFLLTAIPNWTGRLPIAGPPLAGLFGLWVMARLAVLCSEWTSLALAALLDIGFYLLLAGLAAREVLGAKNRNLPIAALVLLFGLANAADYAATTGLAFDNGAGIRAGIALVVLMISLIGGRIIPSFTRNWMMKRGMQAGLPTQPSRFDLITIAATAAALSLWLLLPSHRLTGVALIAAGLFQILRLARWKGSWTWREPLLLILHVGYAWLPIGLLLLGISLLSVSFPGTLAIHALTAGAMATMILAVMSRASLGHTGRELRAGRLTIAAFVLVTLGALLRVGAPLTSIGYMLAIHIAALAWGAAFIAFLIAFVPILCGERPDGKRDG